MVKIGILSLQGGFQAHIEKIEALGAKALRITSSEQLKDIDGLVIPGGESSVFLKLIGPKFKSRLKELDIPTLSTCAGIILLAKKVTNPSQKSLGLIDIEVQRNAYGRQLESFITKELLWTNTNKKTTFKGVFIRAPKILKTGDNVEVLITHNDNAVLVRDGKNLAATFHPELCKDSNEIHQMFFNTITKNK